MASSVESEKVSQERPKIAPQRFFVAGTDTDVGKTLVSCGLLLAAGQRGLATAGLKPIAAGCVETAEGLRNDDALALQNSANTTLSYQQINPVAFATPIAPHIAAQQQGRRLSADRLVGFCRGVLMQKYDVTIVEGAGGWRVPLNRQETLADVAKALSLPVIMVVGVRLGCINHALLTAEAIAADGLPLAGWVSSHVDPAMANYDENIVALEELIRAPCLGHIPFVNNIQPIDIQKYVNIDKLLG